MIDKERRKKEKFCNNQGETNRSFDNPSGCVVAWVIIPISLEMRNSARGLLWDHFSREDRLYVSMISRTGHNSIY